MSASIVYTYFGSGLIKNGRTSSSALSEIQMISQIRYETLKPAVKKEILIVFSADTRYRVAHRRLNEAFASDSGKHHNA